LYNLRGEKASLKKREAQHWRTKFSDKSHISCTQPRWGWMEYEERSRGVSKRIRVVSP